MRFPKALLVALLCCACLPAQQSALKGVYLSDINRQADPCNDFYDYANGAWRAEHPMPASMSMWSRRWASGELSKDQLKEILDDISRRHDWPAGSIEQITGDFYGACMNETQADKLGIAPLQPRLAEVDAIKNAADLQSVIARMHVLAINVPFNVAPPPTGTTRGRSLPRSAPPDCPCPTATTISNPNLAFRRRARTFAPTSAISSGWRGTATRQLRLRRPRSSVSKPVWRRPLSIMSLSAILMPPITR